MNKEVKELLIGWINKQITSQEFIKVLKKGENDETARNR